MHQLSQGVFFGEGGVFLTVFFTSSIDFNKGKKACRLQKARDLPSIRIVHTQEQFVTVSFRTAVAQHHTVVMRQTHNGFVKAKENTDPKLETSNPERLRTTRTRPLHGCAGNSYIKAKCKQEMRRILQSAASQTHTATEFYYQETLTGRPTMFLTRPVGFGYPPTLSLFKNKEQIRDSYTAPSTINCHLPYVIYM